jgi:hypothetical protein
MGDVVRGKFFILYLQLGEDGTEYRPVACAKDVSIRISSEFLELAPRTSTAFRIFKYARNTGKITGTGLTKIDVGTDPQYTSLDLLDYQLKHKPTKAKVLMEDAQGSQAMLEFDVLVEETGWDKTGTASVGHSFTLQINGDPTVTITPVVPPPDGIFVPAFRDQFV